MKICILLCMFSTCLLVSGKSFKMFSKFAY